MKKEPIPLPDHQLPDHHSAVRHILNKRHGRAYEPLKSLKEAKETSNGVVVLEGDYGGIIFASCQAKYVKATQEELESLCIWLEKTYWKELWAKYGNHNKGGWGVYYEVLKPGSGIWGGTKGGAVIDGLWLHPKLKQELVDETVSKLRLVDDVKVVQGQVRGSNPKV